MLLSVSLMEAFIMGSVYARTRVCVLDVIDVFQIFSYFQIAIL